MTLQGNGEYTVQQSKHRVSEALMAGPGDALFDFIAEKARFFPSLCPNPYALRVPHLRVSGVGGDGGPPHSAHPARIHVFARARC